MIRLPALFATLLSILAGCVSAQTVLTVKADAPLGWESRLATSRRSVFTKDLGNGKTATLRVALTSSSKSAVDASDYLAKLKHPNEAAVEGSAADVTLAGEKGRRIDWTADVGDGKKSLRSVSVAKMKNGQFLVVRCETTFAGDRLPDDAMRAFDAGRAAVTQSVALAEVPAPSAADAIAKPPGKLAAAAPVVYENDRVLPFSFFHPGDWDVRDDAFQPSPGTMFAVAAAGADDDETAASALRIALRLQVTAHVAELLGAADPDARLATIARDTINERGKIRIKSGEPPTFIVGAARGVMLEYSTQKDEREARDGICVVAAFGTSVVLADFYYPTEAAKDWRPLAIEMLNTLRVGGESRSEHVKIGQLEFDCPLAWAIAKVKTPDETPACAIRTEDGAELTLRSVDLPKGRSLGAENLDLLAKKLLVEEMALLAETALDDGGMIAIPGAVCGKRWTIEDGARATEIYAFERGGAAHFAFLSLSGGLVTPSYGRLLATIFSMTGPMAPADDGAARVVGGKVKQPLVLGMSSIEPYDADGKIRMESRGRLLLSPDGTATFVLNVKDQPNFRRGTYSTDSSAGRIDFADRTTLDFRWSKDGTTITTQNPSRTWFVLPSLF